MEEIRVALNDLKRSVEAQTEQQVALKSAIQELVEMLGTTIDAISDLAGKIEDSKS